MQSQAIVVGYESSQYLWPSSSEQLIPFRTPLAAFSGLHDYIAFACLLIRDTCIRSRSAILPTKATTSVFPRYRFLS